MGEVIKFVPRRKPQPGFVHPAQLMISAAVGSTLLMVGVIMGMFL